ncbi:dienelactone hydrolase family protein [Colletotrichum truncatum]|uniref:Dienelactone hydrolase family protein n=1 Tax=Colletotrichum truncatum TaxID=5467 RepID=A0ACC3Z8L6_COLTU|nr:dienelactone hydrolase family protein [Colletotrichum truncatum]KAF6789263.1 dienelactone hydrolase family protein [Colletotrichum truncatum]
MAVSSCCLKAFEWDGNPTGHVTKLNSINVYVTGNNPNVAILYIHDLLGWTFSNARLLADHYAREANATVYVPDFFGGETLPFEPLLNGRFHEIDLEGFIGRNSRTIREPEIFEFARALRTRHEKVGAVGFCYGGWAVFRLGAEEHQPPLVDCITAAHPSLLTENDIDKVAVPIQILAPEFDPVFTTELKLHCFRVATSKTVPFEYQHFPGVEHACLVRGDPGKKGEREAMARGKSCTVNWINQLLH